MGARGSGGAGGEDSTRKDALRDAARSVFAEKGYHPATTREIAAKAGCAEGLIRYYFGGKAGLLAAVIEHGETSLLPPKRGLEWLRPSDLMGDLKENISRQVEFMWNEREHYRVFFAQCILDGEMGTTVARDRHLEKRRIFRETLESYRERGEIRSGVDLDAVTDTVFATLLYQGFFAQSVWGLDKAAVQQTVEAIVDALVLGIGSDVRAALAPKPTAMNGAPPA